VQALSGKPNLKKKIAGAKKWAAVGRRKQHLTG
jgi:hypothetical protein